MTSVEPMAERNGSVYSLHGTLIEACSCNVNCPCWIGEDPDLGECFAIVAYGIELLKPSFFFVAVVIICALVGAVTGSSWTTAGTLGVAFIGMAPIIGGNSFGGTALLDT